MLDIDAPDMETLGDSAIYDTPLARNDGFVTPAITRARLAFEYRSASRSCGSCKYRIGWYRRTCIRVRTYVNVNAYG